MELALSPTSRYDQLMATHRPGPGRLSNSRALALALLLGLASQFVLAQEVPLRTPDQIVESAANDIAQRLATVDLGSPRTAEDLLIAARASLGSLANRLLRLGHEELLSLAPSLDGLPIKHYGDRTLDALARYEACQTYLDHDYSDTQEGDASDRRLTAAMGPNYLVLTMNYLGGEYLRNDGDAVLLEAFLTSDRSTSLDQIRQNSDLLEVVRRECHPVMETLFGADEAPAPN